VNISWRVICMPLQYMVYVKSIAHIARVVVQQLSQGMTD